MKKNNIIPNWFTPVVIASLIWNILGLIAFVMHMTLTSEAIALLSEVEQQVLNATPFWINVAFAVAVITGTLGCLALLFKKTAAIPLFALSFIGVTVQTCHGVFLLQTIAIYEYQALFIPLIIMCWGGALLYLSKKAKRHSWLS